MTKVLNWQDRINEEELTEVVECLNNNGLIIFPTDTVYGLGCNSLSSEAIEKVFRLKNRNSNKPINVLTDSLDKIVLVAKNISEKEKQLIEKYMPGALTIILDKKENVPNVLTANLNTIGVRIPNNDIALRLLKEFKYPLATTSVNYSGEKEGIKVEDFFDDFNNKVDYIIDGGVSNIKIASTIVRVENDDIKILREGSIKIDNNPSE